VAGAGASGAAVALALARAGCAVTLADPAKPGDNASGVAAGMLAPTLEALFDPAAAPHLGLMRRARDLWPALAGDVGLELDTTGALAVGGPGDVAAWEASARRLGLACETLSPSQARRRAPWLAPSLGGLWTGEDWRLEPEAALAAFATAARAGGVRLIAAAVTGFEPGCARLTGGRELVADALVVATGASRALSAIAPELAALDPIKGQILRATLTPLSGPVVRSREIYICPARAGAVIGATMAPGRADTRVDPAMTAHLARLASRLAPPLIGGQFTGRAGVRAATLDGLPMVGASRSPGVWLAVGARRNGWLLAPLIAKTIVGALIGRGGDGETVERFNPGRFGPSPAAGLIAP
jgi:glycine oxidase